MRRLFASRLSNFGSLAICSEVLEMISRGLAGTTSFFAHTVQVVGKNTMSGVVCACGAKNVS